MKKIFLYLVPICFCFSLLCYMSGCSKKIEEVFKENLSELHNNYFVGQTENFNISLWSGIREEPYEMDGIKQNTTDFCILNVVPKNKGTETYGLSYTIEINEETQNGEFEKSPYDSSLASDLKIKINDDDSIFVYLVYNAQTEIGKMTCISKDFSISQQQALDIAISNMQNELLELTDNNSESIEAYCKIISTDKNLGVYFWFIDVVNKEGSHISLVIDTTTGEIVARK